MRDSFGISNTTLSGISNTTRSGGSTINLQSKDSANIFTTEEVHWARYENYVGRLTGLQRTEFVSVCVNIMRDQELYFL